MQMVEQRPPDLSEHATRAWVAALPDDVRDTLARSDRDPDEMSAPRGFADAIASLGPDDAWRLPEIIREHPEAAKSLGRARRMRLVAWASSVTYPDSARLLQELTGEDDDGSEQAGSVGESGILFLEDIRAYAEALGARVARLLASATNIEAVMQSAFTLESEDTFTRRGV
jgi:hypothetical protein